MATATLVVAMINEFPTEMASFDIFQHIEPTG